METNTIYVYLLDEGTDVWRPVEAQEVGNCVYKIVSVNTNPEDEEWQFKTGSIVRCRKMKLSQGERIVAFECVGTPIVNN